MYLLKIVIIGIGKVGTYVATQLLKDKHSLTLVDKDDRAYELAKSFDALSLCTAAAQAFRF